MDDASTTSASANPFSMEQHEGDDLPQDPFAPLQCVQSPGNPFMPSRPTSKDDRLHGDDLSPQASIPPMQTPAVGAIMGSEAPVNPSSNLPASESGCHNVVDNNSNSSTTATVTESVAATSPWLARDDGKTSDRGDVCESFGGGFGDDFGTLTQTEVMFKTGLVDSGFKAVAVTAEEDDLWSSSFTMATPSSHDQEPSNQDTDSSLNQNGQEPECINDVETMLGTEVHSVDETKENGQSLEEPKTGDVDDSVLEKDIGNSSKNEGEVLVDVEQDLWTQWPSESQETLQTGPSCADQVQDLWAPEVSVPTQSRDANESEETSSKQVQDPWETDVVGSGDGQGSSRADPFADGDPWTAVLDSASSKTPADQDPMRPTVLEVVPPQTRNPFQSEDCGDSIQNSQASSPFQPQSSNPFQDQDQNRSSVAFQTDHHDDVWSPSALDSGFQNIQDQPKECRSPNPFSSVQQSNPFLQELDLLPETEKKGGADNLNKIPDIPKFDEDGKSGSKKSRKDSASTSSDMEGASAEPLVIPNGMDAHDVTEHDSSFDINDSIDHTRTDDEEFEQDEKMMMIEEDERSQRQELSEMEDIFQNDATLDDPADFGTYKSTEDGDEVEDIFKDEEESLDNHHIRNDHHHMNENNHIVQTEPLIQITFVDTDKSQPSINLENLESLEGTSEVSADVDFNADDLPFPDVPSKSDISLAWEVEEEKPASPTIPPTNIETSPSVPPSAPFPEHEADIDEGEVAKFVEGILHNSLREVGSLAPEQEGEGKVESFADMMRATEPTEENALEIRIDSETVSCQETRQEEEAKVEVVAELCTKEELSVDMASAACAHVDLSILERLEEKHEEKLEEKHEKVEEKHEDHSKLEADIHIAVPVHIVEVNDAEDQPKEVKEIDRTSPQESTPVDKQTPEVTEESKVEPESPKNVEFTENRTRKMSVPKPRDIRKDLSETRPSFFGSSSSGSRTFLSNTLPRVSVLPRISTSYQRKPPTSPLSLSSDFTSTDQEELPTVAKPDLTKDDSQVISGLEVELPHIETLSTEPLASPKAVDDPIVPKNVTKVECAPVFSSVPVKVDPVVLDGTSPEEIEAIFAKDPEEPPEKPKKSMGKDDVIASTRVRKISRDTWSGQAEFQKSIEKSKVILDKPQAASLKRYEERKKKRQEAFSVGARVRVDSTSEAESEGSQCSTTRSTPKMPDVVQSGETHTHQSPQSEIVQPKLNMKSVRSLWEQKAQEVEQRRKSLQTKPRRPMSQGDRTRPSNQKNLNKSSDNIDSLDDSLDGNTTYSYDGASDDSSSKRESLIERDIRLQKERDIEIARERERLRTESTSSRDESQQSETSEGQDDQVVDIVRDTEMRRDSDDGRSSPSQSSGYTSGRSTPSTPSADDILKVKIGKSSKMPELKLSLSPTESEPSYHKTQKGNKDAKYATFPRRVDTKGEPNVSPTHSVGDVPDVIMVDGNKTASSSSSSADKSRKTSIVQQGIKLSQTLEKKKVGTGSHMHAQTARLEIKHVSNDVKPRQSLEMEIAAQREKEEAFRREQQTRSPLPSPRHDDGHPISHTPSSSTSSSSSSSVTSPAITPQGSPRKTSVSGPNAKSVYKDLNYAPQTKKKLALAEHWEHKWK